MGKIVRLGVILFILTAVTGLILGLVYEVTSAPIARTQEQLKMNALAATLPGATDFDEVALQGNAENITAINRGSANGELMGYNFSVSPKGYAGPIQLVVGIAKDGTVTGAQILNHSETPGLGARATEPEFIGQFSTRKVSAFRVVNASATEPELIQAISGATITSAAVAHGVNQAITYFNTHFSDGGVPENTSAQKIVENPTPLKDAATPSPLKAESFKEVALQKEKLGDITAVQEGISQGKSVGYTLFVAPQGYNDPIEMVVGINTDGTISGVQVLRHSESPRRGGKAIESGLLDAFVGHRGETFSVVNESPSTPQEIQALSGATMTVEAVVSGVNQAVTYFNTHLAGGQAQ